MREYLTPETYDDEEVVYSYETDCEIHYRQHSFKNEHDFTDTVSLVWFEGIRHEKKYAGRWFWRRLKEEQEQHGNFVKIGKKWFFIGGLFTWKMEKIQKKELQGLLDADQAINIFGQV